MDTISRKFKEAAKELNALCPDIDRALWNACANNFHKGTPSTITLTFQFFNDSDEKQVLHRRESTLVAETKVECLASPISLNRVALKAVIQDMKKKRFDFPWTSLSLNYGTKNDKEYVEEILETVSLPPEPASVKDLIDTYFNKANSPNEENLVDNLSDKWVQADQDFTAGLFMYAHEIKWDQETIKRNTSPPKGPALNNEASV